LPGTGEEEEEEEEEEEQSKVGTPGPKMGVLKNRDGG
jgi:hypothetical protein